MGVDFVGVVLLEECGEALLRCRAESNLDQHWTKARRSLVTFFFTEGDITKRRYANLVDDSADARPYRINEKHERRENSRALFKTTT